MTLAQTHLTKWILAFFHSVSSEVAPTKLLRTSNFLASTLSVVRTSSCFYIKNHRINSHNDIQSYLCLIKLRMHNLNRLCVVDGYTRIRMFCGGTSLWMCGCGFTAPLRSRGAEHLKLK